MPANVVKSKADEKKWSEAKRIAKSQGKSEKWPLIMHIYQNMKKHSGVPPFVAPVAPIPDLSGVMRPAAPGASASVVPPVAGGTPATSTLKDMLAPGPTADTEFDWNSLMRFAKPQTVPGAVKGASARQLLPEDKEYIKIAMLVGTTIDPNFRNRVAAKRAQLEKDAGLGSWLADFLEHPIRTSRQSWKSIPELLRKLTGKSMNSDVFGLGDIKRALRLWGEELRFKTKMPGLHSTMRGQSILDRKKIKALERELKTLGAWDEQLLTRYLKSLTEQQRLRYSPYYLDLLKKQGIIH